MTAWLAIPLLAGAGYLFVQETAPPSTHVRKPPPAELSDVERAQADAFPAYEQAIPVLTFHDVSDRRDDYTITAAQLANHLAALRAAGFHSVGLDDVARVVSGRPTELPSRPILLTFDDGPSTNWTAAQPILKKYDFRGVAFLITGQMAHREPSYYLTWPQARAMRDSGQWELGAHTNLSHRRVALPGGGEGPALINRITLPDGSTETIDQWRDRITQDIDKSNRQIKAELGKSPTAFAFPFNAAEAPTDDEQIPAEVASLVGQRYQLAFRGARSGAVITSSSAALGLPRLSVMATTTTSGLLDDLKAALPLPLPADVGLLTWAPTGDGSCHAVRGAVTLTSSAYLRCQPTGNSSRWDDYRLSATVKGTSPQATAIIAMRSSPDAKVEVAIGASRAEVRQQVGKAPVEVLGDFPLASSSATDRNVRLTARGTDLTVEIDGVAPAAFPLDPRVKAGFVGFGLAANGSQTATFDALSVVPYPPDQVGSTARRPAR